MLSLTCKMCGGVMNIQENAAVAECEYCGTRQTVPRLDDEKKNALFERANVSRANCEFDKAAIIYENIINEFPDEAEAYWGLCLCRYGIEYVEDPKTNKRIPTCHRTQFKSILEDGDYLAAIDNADVLARELYKSEAEYIDKVQKEILAISSKEEPFDIFICYKETDDTGNRTIDSVIAQDIYTELTDKGYRVFFARITLYEEYLGRAYEPYIFAALNSAKVMLVVATKPEYFEAVWVKNEWSRFLALIQQGERKNIIPCFRNMEPEKDFPPEFQPLQAQDVSKVGYMQDLVRGIQKIITPGERPVARVKRAVPPARKEKLISHIHSFGTNNKNDFWPKSAITSIINTNLNSVVTFNIFLQRPIGVNGSIPLEFYVYDENGNVMTSSSEDIHTEAGYDRFAKTWVLVGDDGSKVNAGAYKAKFSVNGSEAFEYNFRVVGGGAVKYNNYTQQSRNVQPQQQYVPQNQPHRTNLKNRWVYVLLCFFLGMFSIHNFYAGKHAKAVVQLIVVFATSGIGYIWVAFDFFRAILSNKFCAEHNLK